MILKQKIIDSEGRKGYWAYTDGITECSIFYDTERECFMIDLTKDKGCIPALLTETYLLNDQGKTIERICYGNTKTFPNDPSRNG